ncbi:hypothetical protein [Spirosoma sp.]|uniref:hypothetical protein n=1 Tax=Spirosoma sp. TaxID=1899569 RepID=UPI00262D8270|nr:hypothetical protein [Spirosoma sp.]MCX6217634.1 hypothetical protein [Spirosoma sp.]
MLTNKEIEEISQRVAQTLQGESPVAVNGCSMMPLRPAINEEHINEVAAQCVREIVNSLHSDEEQFIAIGRIRDGISKHWDDQLRTSSEVVKINSDRANNLSRFIEMTTVR